MEGIWERGLGTFFWSVESDDDDDDDYDDDIS